MTTAPIQTLTGSGYNRRDGRFADVETLTPLPSQAFAAGTTVGPVFELGDHRLLHARLRSSASSGTSPTLAATLQTSHDGSTNWRTVDTFATQTTAGGTMTGVASGGTSPPVITLTGAASRPLNLKVVCSTLGARGTSQIQISLDGGLTYQAPVATAATVPVLDENGVATGVVLNIATGPAAVDNYWTASNAGDEQKQFPALDRFGRFVLVVGGSATPTVTASIVAEAA